MSDGSKKYIFIIDDILEYNPQRNELKVLMSDLDIITLNVPVSRCLELLLLNHDKIISQSDFFYDVWEKNGTYITLGTFYQNISLLRKALNHAGLDDIVVTVPRKGLSIAKKTKVEKKISPEYIQNTSVNVVSKNDGFIRRFKTIIIYFILFMIGITPLSIMNYFDEHYVPIYNFLLERNSCNIHSLGVTDDSKILRAFDDLKLNCSKLNYVYISAHPYLNEVSIIQCDRPFNSTSKIDCLTITKVGGIDE